MCFHISLTRDRDYLENRFDAQFEDSAFDPKYYVGAFEIPFHPVITDRDPGTITRLQWGLVPRWTGDMKAAEAIRTKTMNARAETVFEKPSYRASIKDRRCLVLVDGFFEWREFEGKKYPYYIRLRDKEAFALGGLWEEWGKGKEGRLSTFSVITTRANPMMEEIHNRKKRMPVILAREDERRWLDPGLKKENIEALMEPFDQEGMEAWTVSRIVSKPGANKNVPEAIARFDYKELQTRQKRLF